MTIRPPDPARDRRTIKVQDRRYKETQLYILQQCTPGETYGPPPEDEQTDLLFRAMSVEGHLIEVESKRYFITAKGQEYRDRLQRPAWRQWLLDNAQWVTPTFVAVASIIVAICALILGTK
jgi:hypothetical protein